MTKFIAMFDIMQDSYCYGQEQVELDSETLEEAKQESENWANDHSSNKIWYWLQKICELNEKGDTIKEHEM